MSRDASDAGTADPDPTGRVEVRTLPHAAVITVGGEIDVANIDIVRQALVRAGREADVIIIDLTNVVYMDSSMIGLLVAESQRARMRRADLRVVAPSGGRPRRVLSLSGVERTLALYESLDESVPSV